MARSSIALKPAPKGKLKASNPPYEGHNIRRRRKTLGLSLSELAKVMGVSRSQIDKLERGERRLTVDWLKKLCLALECTPLELLPSDLQAMMRESQFLNFESQCEVRLEGKQLVVRMQMPSEYKMLDLAEYLT